MTMVDIFQLEPYSHFQSYSSWFRRDRLNYLQAQHLNFPKSATCILHLGCYRTFYVRRSRFAQRRTKMSPFIDAAAENGRSTPAPLDTLNLPSVASPDAPKLYNWTNVNERGYEINEEPMDTKHPLKIIILGAGASGINFLKTAQDKLENIELVCYEKNKNVGGTWLENTYVFSCRTLLLWTTCP